ncbi:hypothetical protein [Pediococcus pentosaceus]|uniref:hypothetical protein n=1 Tax=Pediococcus pentosaceus TaxID=1255 RepID=UPI001C7E0B2A|nr:hypothetical protein [Pediococcus pentosaceus]QYY85109.1 hypothetical protein GRI00_00450 [Pediococcus pentosaceus]
MTFDNETLAIFNYADQKAYKMACQINSLNLMNDVAIKECKKARDEYDRWEELYYNSTSEWQLKRSADEGRKLNDQINHYVKVVEDNCKTIKSNLRKMELRLKVIGLKQCFKKL